MHAVLVPNFWNQKCDKRRNHDNIWTNVAYLVAPPPSVAGTQAWKGREWKAIFEQ